MTSDRAKGLLEVRLLHAPPRTIRDHVARWWVAVSALPLGVMVAIVLRYGT